MNKHSRGFAAWLVFLSCHIGSGSAQAQVFRFQEDLFPTTSYQASATFVREIAPETNFNNSNFLYIGNDGAGRVRSLFSFDLSSLPHGLMVTSVTFQLRVSTTDSSSSGSSNVPLEIHFIPGSFSESTVTWNNQPLNTALLSSLTANPTLLQPGDLLVWPSTASFLSAAQTALDAGGPLSFLIRASDAAEAANVREAFFPNDDDTSPPVAEFHPLLTITLAVPEPSVVLLTGLGFCAGMSAWCRRRRPRLKQARMCCPK